MWLLFLTTTLLMHPIFRGEDLIEGAADVKVVDCVEKIYAKDSGRIYLEFENFCEVYVINIGTKNKTSILHVKTTILHSETETTSTKKGIKEEKSIDDVKNGSNIDNRGVEIKFYEQTTQRDGKVTFIPLVDWNIENIDESNLLTNKSYLSRTPEVKIQIRIEGNWRNYRIQFSYDEIKYDEIELDYLGLSGEIESPTLFEGRYRPNTIILYRIKEVALSNKSSILISLERFEVDIAAGEHILIGAGTKPFEGSKPLFISQPQNGSTFYVHDSSAYILFVARSTQNKRSGFTLRWEHTGTLTPKEEDSLEDPRNALKSRDICFYNVSKEDCIETQNEDGRFYKFRRHFSEVVRIYANITEISYMDILKELNASSVVLHGVEKCKNLPLNAIIQVKNQGKSILSWKQLGEMIDHFQTHYPEDQVGHCPVSFATDNKAWSFFIYLSVPVFALFLLALWAWKQKVFEENCSSLKVEDKLLIGHQNKTVEPNLYDRTTIPKVFETTEEGRRRTLVAVNSAPADVERNSCQRNEVRLTDIPQSSYGPTSLLNLPRTKRRPSIQPLILQEDLIRLAQIRTSQKDENEHHYDLVSLTSHTETKL